MSGNGGGLARNRHLIQDLSSAIRDGAAGLGDVPGLVRRVLEEGAWREFTTPLGETVRHRTFAGFVAAEGLRGLGTTVKMIRKLVADDPATLNLLDKELENQPGRPPGVAKTFDNIQGSSAPTGTSREQALRRLRREAEAGNELAAELRNEVLAGRVKPHTAMVEAGLRKRTLTVSVTEPASVAESLRKHMSPEHLAELARLLNEEN